MAGGIGLQELRRISRGSHVCWVVDDAATYCKVAGELLVDAEEKGEKAFLFGPEGSASMAALAPLAAVAADPWVVFLDRGPLDPDAMLSAFREQSALAREEGFHGIRIVADMDWLLPAEPSSEAIVGFELLLDRLVKELDATIVCAYRWASFDPHAVEGSSCVHPIDVGRAAEAQFRLVAGDERTWRLTGEVDISQKRSFDAAVVAAASAACEIDVSELAFIDVAGMHAIAGAARAAAVPVRLIGARPLLCRTWELAGFGEAAPTVELEPA